MLCAIGCLLITIGSSSLSTMLKDLSTVLQECSRAEVVGTGGESRRMANFCGMGELLTLDPPFSCGGGVRE